jgi:hypothetical protein
MKSVAITQRLKSLGRVSTLSYPVAIQGILKHTIDCHRDMLILGDKPNRFIVCFRMLITEKQHPDPSDGFSRNSMRP